jgi:hypothetical protein
VDPPAGPRPHVLVVVSQVPHEIGDLIAGDGPVMSDTRDSAQRVVGIVARGIHLSDDRVLGAGNPRQRCHR